MRSLSLNIVILIWAFVAAAQENPHGEQLKQDCSDCHTTEGWNFVNTGKFNHKTTNFTLEGQHKVTECTTCHTSLVFSEAKTSCVDCHTDMHNTTVGSDCARCHNSQSWIVSNITELHQMSRFPLLGAHTTADCYNCHTSVSRLEFEPLGVECIDCHRQDYMATTNPNHQQAGLSTNCIECHKIDAHEWSASGINHDFFPLTLGHAINQCAACHTSGISEPVSNDCYSCHQNDYLNATNPSHQNSAFSTNCLDCHTTNPDWNPAEFKTHDNLFPIYSGKHNGEWNNCTDCHQQPENYSVFSCTDCHEHNKPDTDDDHKDVAGYSYNSTACLACHPTGNEESAFNHNATTFPLKGAHVSTECSACHTSGYAETSTDCNHCHSANFNQAANPDHVSAGISTDCATCHIENGWTPSNFNHTTTTGFELIGGHAGRQCADCHQGTTSGANSDCISCHQNNYNEAKDHVTQGFPTNCLQCHTINSWDAANFDHNNTNFPLTGAHIATECASCHSSGYTGTNTLCSGCHQTQYNNTTNPNHISLGISAECENCHTTAPGWAPALFPNHSDYYTLSGAHALVANSCYLCHSGNYTNTPNTCYNCHSNDYNNTTDPNHLSAQFSTDCQTCHTESAWTPSTFNHDNQYFPIYSGEHRGEWNTCTDCHTLSANFSAFSCLNCHEHNITDMNAKHQEVSDYAYNSASCLACHPTGNADD
uniref:hypothetical protein n=1 Tax=uncultured Draconibacterium sp. TaxID=1573823 RepID=UPI003216E399